MDEMVSKSAQPEISPILPFQRVTFVAANESPPPNKINKLEKINFCLLNGNEVRQFYDELTAVPPSKSQSVTTTLCKKDKSQLRKINTKLHRNQNEKNCAHKQHSTRVHKTLDKKSVNILFKYAQDGNLEGIQECVEKGFNVNERDMYGWTPLMCAVCAAHLSVIKYLLLHGADVRITDRHGMTALDLSRRYESSKEIQNILLNPHIINIERIKQEKIEQKVEFCDICKMAYSEPKNQHERSIAHLFNSGHKSKSTFYHIPESNVGFKLMLKEGWDKNKGLGPSGTGKKFPVKTVLKQDRSCLGSETKAKARVTHFGPHDTSSIDRRNAQYRKPVVIREKTLKKREREKLERRNRQKEINFRREFNMDS